MSLILFDDQSWDNLLPLTFTRPVSGLRIGILTIAEKWERDLGIRSSPLTRDYLRQKFPCKSGDATLYVNSTVLPEAELVQAIGKLEREQALVQGTVVIAVRKWYGRNWNDS